MNRAEDLRVMDELRVHVGVVVHHLPGEGESNVILNECIQNKKNTEFRILKLSDL